MIETFLGHGETHQSPAVLGHEVDGVRCYLFGGHGKVALVLAVFVVDDHDHPAGAISSSAVSTSQKGALVDMGANPRF